MRERALAGAADNRCSRGLVVHATSRAIAVANSDGSAGLDLMPGFTFVQPDDGNPDDRTLAAVALPAPVPPGGEIAIRVEWTARVPRTFARTGGIGNYYFSRTGSRSWRCSRNGGWTAHQFHANTEFFSDYGRYDVRMTVPRGWVVGATGTQQAHDRNGDGTTTHRYVQDDVHDFAWTTSPDYVEHRDTFRHERLPTVAIRLLLQPEHRGQEDRHFARPRRRSSITANGTVPIPSTTSPSSIPRTKVARAEWSTRRSLPPGRAS